MAIRLDKFLAEMGIGTRTEVKKLIKAKQITINGETNIMFRESVSLSTVFERNLNIVTTAE